MDSEEERNQTGNSYNGLSNLQTRALNDSMANLMNAGLEQIHLRLDEIQSSQPADILYIYMGLECAMDFLEVFRDICGAKGYSKLGSDNVVALSVFLLKPTGSADMNNGKRKKLTITSNIPSPLNSTPYRDLAWPGTHQYQEIRRPSPCIRNMQNNVEFIESSTTLF
ncbi:hypothetical protein YC2023_085365 [Brassica napus]